MLYHYGCVALTSRINTYEALSVCLSVFLSVRLFTCLSLCPPYIIIQVCLCDHLPVCLPDYLSVPRWKGPRRYETRYNQRRLDYFSRVRQLKIAFYPWKAWHCIAMKVKLRIRGKLDSLMRCVPGEEGDMSDDDSHHQTVNHSFPKLFLLRSSFSFFIPFSHIFSLLHHHVLFSLYIPVSRVHFQALRTVTRSQRVLRIRVLQDWRGYANRLLMGPFQVMVKLERERDGWREGRKEGNRGRWREEKKEGIDEGERR
jgi:hypothetical protein